MAPPISTSSPRLAWCGPLRQVLGAAHADTLTSMADLGALIAAQGRLGEAEPLLRQARCSVLFSVSFIL